MDDNNAITNSQISSLLLGHLLSSSSSSAPSIASASSSCTGFSEHNKAKTMPFSSFSSFVPCSAGAAAAMGGCESALPLGFDPVSFLQCDRGQPPEPLDFDGYDCESEEGLDVPEEPAKLAPSRCSKRSRAAEVHNLSEKRRRSRINEKMKALQNLIPNSNKTDKASMLDEAIEYLKQLQLQVQMLSMRNGLSLHPHPMYFPGALQPLQASQMRLVFGEDNGSMLNTGVGMLHMNQDSSAQNPFDPSNRCLPSHQSIIPSSTNIINQVNSFGVEATESHQASFHLPMAAEEVYTEDMLSQQHLDTGPSSRNLPENQMKSMDPAATSLPFDEQASTQDGTDHLEACVLSSGKLQNMLSNDQENEILIQHMHALQTGKGDPHGDVKAETRY